MLLKYELTLRWKSVREPKKESPPRNNLHFWPASQIVKWEHLIGEPEALAFNSGSAFCQLYDLGPVPSPLWTFMSLTIKWMVWSKWPLGYLAALKFNYSLTSKPHTSAEPVNSLSQQTTEVRRLLTFSPTFLAPNLPRGPLLPVHKAPFVAWSHSGLLSRLLLKWLRQPGGLWLDCNKSPGSPTQLAPAWLQAWPQHQTHLSAAPDPSLHLWRDRGNSLKGRK